MTYIYDTPLEINAVTFERYGVVYKLEQTFKMGNRKFASFKADGMDKILVVPQFVEQYNRLAARLLKLAKNKTFEECVRYVRQQIDPDPVLDEEPDENGVMVPNITCQFKDIKVKLYYRNGIMELDPEFEIVQNNIFGNGILVDTKPEEDE